MLPSIELAPMGSHSYYAAASRPRPSGLVHKRVTSVLRQDICNSSPRWRKLALTWVTQLECQHHRLQQMYGEPKCPITSWPPTTQFPGTPPGG